MDVWSSGQSEIEFVDSFTVTSSVPTSVAVPTDQLADLALKQESEQIFQTMLEDESLEPTIGFTAHMASLLVDDYLDIADRDRMLGGKTQASRNSLLVLSFHGSGTPTAVIESDVNNLTKQEVLDNRDACDEAMKEELKRWLGQESLKRQPRASARNILDCRWVLEWKYIQGVRVVRARLTVRGFKDSVAAWLETFAGTTSKWGQRLINHIVAHQRWSICSADISQAFLKGLTFEQIAAETGTEARIVHVDLPAATVQLLQTIPGYEDFNSLCEVLLMVRPGFGLKDAPRAWNLRLVRIIISFGAHPCHADQQVFYMHKDGVLVMALSAHVDDLKITGEMPVIRAFLKHMGQHFGELTEKWHEFEHCGIMHMQNKENFEVITHQRHYIVKLNGIDNSLLGREPDDKLVDKMLHGLFLRLLGGVAWCQMTRGDMSVYIVALQRVSHCPTYGAVRRLNKIVAYMKKNPVDLHYFRLEDDYRLLVISDSAYKRESDDDCLAMRGAIIALGFVSGRVIALEWYAGKHKLVCRSTFAAELLGLLDAVDLGILIAMALYELRLGTCKPEDLVRLRTNGNMFPVKISAVLDARSVYEAIIHSFVGLKPPSERSLIAHLAQMKEFLRDRVVDALLWVDTRDMAADGLNKGTVPRDALKRFLIEGIWHLEHEFAEWRAPTAVSVL